jgi:hypothetical protein
MIGELLSSLEQTNTVPLRLFAGMTLAAATPMRPTPRLILIVFLLAQVFDGILTYVAVAWLGVVGEGNLLLASAMNLVGAGPALFGAKTLAAGCGLLLYTRGLHGVLGVLTGLYMLAAIGPWLLVFHTL